MRHLCCLLLVAAAVGSWSEVELSVGGLRVYSARWATNTRL